MSTSGVHRKSSAALRSQPRSWSNCRGLGRPTKPASYNCAPTSWPTYRSAHAMRRSSVFASCLRCVACMCATLHLLADIWFLIGSSRPCMVILISGSGANMVLLTVPLVTVSVVFPCWFLLSSNSQIATGIRVRIGKLGCLNCPDTEHNPAPKYRPFPVHPHMHAHARTRAMNHRPPKRWCKRASKSLSTTRRLKPAATMRAYVHKSRWKSWQWWQGKLRRCKRWVRWALCKQ